MENKPFIRQVCRLLRNTALSHSLKLPEQLIEAINSLTSEKRKDFYRTLKLDWIHPENMIISYQFSTQFVSYADRRPEIDSFIHQCVSEGMPASQIKEVTYDRFNKVNRRIFKANLNQLVQEVYNKLSQNSPE